MDKNIKERWKAIDQGLVPKGYRKTKVGIVPEDWDVKKFSELFKVSQGLQIPIKDRLNSAGEDRYIYITNELINNLKNKNYNIEYIEKPNSNVISNKEDILMTRTGNTGIVVSGIEGVFHNNFFKIRYDEEAINRLFLIYRLESDDIQHEIKKLAGTSTIPDLTHGDFYSLYIAFPEISEQEKIADILSTWDRAIESYGKLLEEKKERKKGLMQLLLTGEKRLGGFTGPWKEVRLGEIGEFKTSSVDKKIRKNEHPINLLNYMDVYNNNTICREIKFVESTASNSQLQVSDVLKGDIFFTPSSETREDIGRSSVVLDNIDNLLYSYHLIRFRLYKNFDMDLIFRAYCFNNIEIHKQFYSLATGSTRYTLSIKDFNGIKIRIPDLEEQKAIAEVLATADREIDLLEKLIEELEEEKKGLMQLLLKGIVRV